MHRKKLIHALIAAGLIIVLTTGITFASLGSAIVSDGPLRLREEDNTNSTVLDSAPEGTTVELLSDAKNGWYLVSYRDKIGYMSAAYLTPLTSSTTAPASSVGTITYALNIRTGPGISYQRITTLPKGATVSILSESSGWYEISCGSITGYASAQYIKVEQSSSSGDNTANQTGLVNAGLLYVRSGPGTSYSRVGSLKRNSMVTILETSNGWHKIISGTLSGYVSADYITIQVDAGTDQTPSGDDTANQTGLVNTSKLNVRSGPGTDYDKIGSLKKGTSVTILATENGWHKITSGSLTGYVSTEYISVGVSSIPDSDEPVSETKTGAVNTSRLNVRSGPGTDYDKVGSLLYGTTVTVLATENGWYKISTSSLTGYVSAEYITIGGLPSTGGSNSSGGSGSSGSSDNDEPAEDPVITTPDVEMSGTGLVIYSSLNVRTGPSTKFSRVGSLGACDKVTILASNNGWYKITSGSLTGYVNGKYIAILGDSSSSEVGAAAAAMAVSLLGKPYVYGAEGPNAFDCSGLSYYIYKQLGYSLNRTSSAQFDHDGRYISLDEMQPGDLLFIFDPHFDSSGGAKSTTHMGIYVGDGKFIHASTTSWTVQYDNVYNSYYTKYIVGAKRIG